MSFKIIKKQKLNSLVYLFEIKAPLIAEEAKAGQFVMLRIDEEGERIPITIAKTHPQKGIITIIFQEAGKTTRKLATLKEKDNISDMLGPLGKASDFKGAGKVVFIGGGVGIAEILPVIEYAKKNGNKVTAILGARTKELIILEEEIRKSVDTLIVTTDDGSSGKKGLVTDALVEVLDKEKFDLAYCVGPDIMMKYVSITTKKYGLKTLVSLDANMLDATGMCATCRVTVAGETKFTCVDGPEFDGHSVDWDEFISRQKRFKAEEERALKIFNDWCKCTAGAKK